MCSAGRGRGSASTVCSGGTPPAVLHSVLGHQFKKDMDLETNHEKSPDYGQRVVTPSTRGQAEKFGVVPPGEKKALRETLLQLFNI